MSGKSKMLAQSAAYPAAFCEAVIAVALPGASCYGGQHDDAQFK